MHGYYIYEFWKQENIWSSYTITQSYRKNKLITDKINLNRSDKYIALSNLSICYK